MGRNTCGQEGEMKKSQNKYRVFVRVHVLIFTQTLVKWCNISACLENT